MCTNFALLQIKKSDKYAPHMQATVNMHSWDMALGPA